MNKVYTCIYFLIDDFNASSSEDEMKHEIVNIKTWLRRKDVVQVISSKEISIKTRRAYDR